MKKMIIRNHRQTEENPPTVKGGDLKDISRSD